MQYHACLITADGSYHCPVGSKWPFLAPSGALIAIWFWSLLQFKGYIYLNLNFYFKFASTFNPTGSYSSTESQNVNNHKSGKTTEDNNTTFTFFIFTFTFFIEDGHQAGCRCCLPQLFSCLSPTPPRAPPSQVDVIPSLF